MDAQLIQAGLSKVEQGRARAKKAYAGMTEEQKEERRAKQAEAARAKRAAKAAVRNAETAAVKAAAAAKEAAEKAAAEEAARAAKAAEARETLTREEKVKRVRKLKKFVKTVVEPKVLAKRFKTGMMKAVEGFKKEYERSAGVNYITKETEGMFLARNYNEGKLGPIQAQSRLLLAKTHHTPDTVLKKVEALGDSLINQKLFRELFDEAARGDETRINRMGDVYGADFKAYEKHMWDGDRAYYETAEAAKEKERLAWERLKYHEAGRASFLGTWLRIKAEPYERVYGLTLDELRAQLGV